ncbi:MAG: ABC transporter substrate-binding protein [Myxococcota bacterium]|jgi:ABC-type branched-subunit amino acid transport system substrate-binding protein|nr:ABC transporter substrate-binding protein [Myxococcota bacterium]
MRRFFVLSIVFLSCVEPSTYEAPDNAWHIGALLPYTGINSSGAENVEQAILLAIEQTNALGGVAERPLWLVSRNTQSNTSLGLAEARALIENDGVVAILGPEDSGLVRILRSILKSKGVLQLSADVTAAPTTVIDDGGMVFQVVPSIGTLGASLASLLREAQPKKTVVFYVNDDYGIRFRDALWCALGELPAIAFGEEEASLAEAVAAFPVDADAAVLIGYPRSSAALIQRLSARTSTPIRWFLAPSLRNPRLLANLPAGALESALGLAPTLSDADRRAFESLFTQRWGALPSYASPFYYDAAVLLALAMASANAAGASPLNGAAISEHLHRVASPPGSKVAWSQLGQAMELIRAGEDIDYVGVTGDVDLDESGETSSGLLDRFEVQGGSFVTKGTQESVSLETCLYLP